MLNSKFLQAKEKSRAKFFSKEDILQDPKLFTLKNLQALYAVGERKYFSSENFIDNLVHIHVLEEDGDYSSYLDHPITNWWFDRLNEEIDLLEIMKNIQGRGGHYVFLNRFMKKLPIEPVQLIALLHLDYKAKVVRGKIIINIDFNGAKLRYLNCNFESYLNFLNKKPVQALYQKYLELNENFIGMDKEEFYYASHKIFTKLRYMLEEAGLGEVRNQDYVIWNLIRDLDILYNAARRIAGPQIPIQISKK